MSILDLERLRQERLAEVWERYCAAARRAQSTNAIEDGITAGRLWREWLGLFTGQAKGAPKGSASVVRLIGGTANERAPQK